MAIRGANSQSFLRERDDFTIAVGDFIEGYDIESSVSFKNMLHAKDAQGKYLYSKKQLFNITENMGYNKHLVVNAKNLLGMSKDKINSINEEFADYLDDLGISGILEFHANDKTQKSFHYHFWTNNDSTHVYDALVSFVLENQIADKDNVNIQGRYHDFESMERNTKNKDELKDIKIQVVTIKKAKVSLASSVIENSTSQEIKPKRAKSLIAKMLQHVEETKISIDKLINKEQYEIEYIDNINSENIQNIYEELEKSSKEILKLNQAILNKKR